MIKKAVKVSMKRLLCSPLAEPLSRFCRGQGTILMYHRIVDSKQSSSNAFDPNLELLVKLEEFDRQMKYLKSNYRCIGLTESVEKLRKGGLEEKSVVVTFDDGHRDNLTLALPILKKYEVPATFFITTGLIEKSFPLWWYEQEDILKTVKRLAIEWDGKILSWNLTDSSEKAQAFDSMNKLFKQMHPKAQELFMERVRSAAGMPPASPVEAMTWQEIKEIEADPLITIGAHTQDHRVLSQLNRDELRGEVLGSKNILEEKLHHEVLHFAYPFGGRGEADRREFNAAKKSGFRSAVTTRPGHLFPFHKDHLFSLPRVAVGFHDRLEDFVWKLSGIDAFFERPMGRFTI